MSKDKKIKVKDLKKWTTRLFTDLGILFFLTIVLISLGDNNYININDVGLPFYIGTLIIFFTLWIYRYKKWNKYVSIEEYKNLMKNSPDNIVREDLLNQGFKEKEIQNILKDRPLTPYIENQNRTNLLRGFGSETETAKKIIDNFKLLDVDEMIDFLNEYPKASTFFNAYRKKDENDDFKEVEDWCEKYNITFEEYKYIDSELWSKKNYVYWEKILNKLKKELKKVIEEEYSDTDYICYKYRILSSSVSSFNVKAEYLMINNNKFMFIKNPINWIINDSDTEPLQCYELREKIRLYKRGQYSLKNNVEYSIDKKDIIYFASEGSKSINTIISGGGISGNINEHSAKMMQQPSSTGLFLDGDAGAIRSMLNDLKVDPIETKLVETDERVVVLKTKKDDFIFERIYNNTDLYLFFVNRMPEKDIQRVSLEKQKQSETNNLSQIKELKELLDMGAITQEEFDKKKKELLK